MKKKKLVIDEEFEPGDLVQVRPYTPEVYPTRLPLNQVGEIQLKTFHYGMMNLGIEIPIYLVKFNDIEYVIYQDDLKMYIENEM